jgi:hypothetical protein
MQRKFNNWRYNHLIDKYDTFLAAADFSSVVEVLKESTRRPNAVAEG